MELMYVERSPGLVAFKTVRARLARETHVRRGMIGAIILTREAISVCVFSDMTGLNKYDIVVGTYPFSMWQFVIGWNVLLLSCPIILPFSNGLSSTSI